MIREFQPLETLERGESFYLVKARRAVGQSQQNRNNSLLLLLLLLHLLIGFFAGAAANERGQRHIERREALLP
jgi:hypothetical protein